MKFNPNLAAVHAYLCADGYVIRNPPEQKHKYYYIALRNTNYILLKDFQEKFEAAFGVRPILVEGQRCKIQSKELYFLLIRAFTTFYSHGWAMPKLSKRNAKFWLRTFFDCESWVEIGSGSSIRMESVNKKGLEQIKSALLQHFGINASLRERQNRRIWRLNICGKDDLLKFRNFIGFLHPNKKEKLELVFAKCPARRARTIQCAGARQRTCDT